MEEAVTVIYFGEDGDPPSIEWIGKSVLRARLREDYYGKGVQFAQPADRVETSSFVGLVVIDGPIVVPRPVEVATDYII